MFKKVENNITNSLAVIADTSSATRFALFPGCYDEARQAWKGVKAYENGTFGTEIWFTQCYVLESTGKNLWDLSHITLNASNPLKRSLFRCGAIQTVTASTKEQTRNVFTALLPTSAKKMTFSLPSKTANINSSVAALRVTTCAPAAAGTRA